MSMISSQLSCPLCIDLGVKAVLISFDSSGRIRGVYRI